MRCKSTVGNKLNEFLSRESCFYTATGQISTYHKLEPGLGTWLRRIQLCRILFPHWRISLIPLKRGIICHSPVSLANWNCILLRAPRSWESGRFFITCSRLTRFSAVNCSEIVLCLLFLCVAPIGSLVCVVSGVWGWDHESNVDFRADWGLGQTF